MTLVILAAGMGSRYGGLKQIEPIGAEGEFIIDYSVYDAIRAGFDKVAFIIKRDFYESFKNTIGARVEGKIKVQYVFQDMDNLPTKAGSDIVREKPWGTAHALYCCKGVVDDDFAVINADDFYGRHSYELMADFLKNKNNKGIDHYSMIGFMLRNTLTEHGHVARGLCEVENGYLQGIDERTKIQRNNGVIQYFEEASGWVDVKEETYASMNFWGFSPTIFDHIENHWEEYIKESASNPTKTEFYIPVLVKKLLAANKCDVRVIETTDKWQGVTYASDKSAVVDYIKRLTAAGDYPVGLWS